MNRKAQIFTMTAILLLFLFFMSYEIYVIYNDGQTARKRVKTMDSFLYSLEKDFEREAYISGFRILFLAEDYILKNQEFIDSSYFFEEAFFNGTVRGIEKSLMDGATFPDMAEKIQERASKINVLVNISNMEVGLFQDNPWEIVFYMNFTLNMSDSSGLAYWHKQEFIAGRIPIEGFEDPLYVVNTNARVPYKINRTIFEGNYVVDGDITNLNNHLKYRYYAENKDAPGFLMRLGGQIGADENGIESFVDLAEFSRQEIDVYVRSVVDHEYFSEVSGKLIPGMPSWFRIGEGHLYKYNCTGLA